MTSGKTLYYCPLSLARHIVAAWWKPLPLDGLLVSTNFNPLLADWHPEQVREDLQKTRAGIGAGELWLVFKGIVGKRALVRWNDDAGWAAYTARLRDLAVICRETQVAGIVVDGEQAGVKGSPPSRMWKRDPGTLIGQRAREYVAVLPGLQHGFMSPYATDPADVEGWGRWCRHILRTVGAGVYWAEDPTIPNHGTRDFTEIMDDLAQLRSLGCTVSISLNFVDQPGTLGLGQLAQAWTVAGSAWIYDESHALFEADGAAHLQAAYARAAGK